MTVEAGSSGLRLLAPAKINLALEVTARRDDGYHDIDTVMTTIDLADRVTLRPASRLTVTLGGPASAGIDPADDLAGRAARCTGRGEIVEPLPDLAPLRLLILVPPGEASEGKTASRYGGLHPEDFSAGESSWRLAQRLSRRAPPPTNDLVNVFERVVERDEPELVTHYARYRSAGAPRLHLCGSGPAVFMFVREQAQRSRLRRDFERAGARVFEASTLGREAALAVESIGALEPSEGGDE